ncbi:MAG: S-methyl-5'-thioadenosine phosphorylase [Kiritimatiellia bacterium]
MKLGIIGGSGVYDIEGIEHVESMDISTPFGQPSDCIRFGRLGKLDVYFLPRHGHSHNLLPSELNHRANIFAFKTLGVHRILSISAVGSLREDFKPRDVVFLDQFFDRTKASGRHTFFGNGVVAHVPFGDPVCGTLSRELSAAAHRVLARRDEKGMTIHEGGTYVNMEGPAFSTRAESNVYRKLGFDIIGMTTLAEAKLAREAEICYACMGLVTDYDSWHETKEPVSVEMVVKTLKTTVAFAKETIREFATAAKDEDDCTCRHALENAIMTDHAHIPEKIKRDLAPIIGKYVK